MSYPPARQATLPRPSRANQLQSAGAMRRASRLRSAQARAVHLRDSRHRADKAQSPTPPADSPQSRTPRSLRFKPRPCATRAFVIHTRHYLDHSRTKSSGNQLPWYRHPNTACGQLALEVWREEQRDAYADCVGHIRATQGSSLRKTLPQIRERSSRLVHSNVSSPGTHSSCCLFAREAAARTATISCPGVPSAKAGPITGLPLEDAKMEAALI